MARMSYVELEAASPEVREIYETTLRGKPNSVQKLLAHRPDMLKNFIAFYASVGTIAPPAHLRAGLHPRFHDQRLPLLSSASPAARNASASP